jgi:hypothetical protein
LGPNQSPGQDRITVTFAPKPGPCAHDISFVFADHPVPLENLVFDHASRIVSLGRPWTAYVLAEHKITCDSDVLTWSGIQAVTIEDLDGIVAEAAAAAATTPAKDPKPTVLATRDIDSDKYMVHPGLARLHYGLRGRHGTAFLQKILAAYRVHQRSPKTPIVSSAHALVVSSSHIGVFTPQPDQRRLLEMPFFADLFGIDGTALVFYQPLPTTEPSEIAWFDWPTTRAPTPTARDIVAVDPLHQVDAASLDVLLAPNRADRSVIELEGLFSVEQYFAKPDILSADKSAEPIWLRALLALNALWKKAQGLHVESKLLALDPISLVPTVRVAQDDTNSRGYAVVLLRVGAAKGDGGDGAPTPARGELIVCDGSILRRADLPDWLAKSLSDNAGDLPNASAQAAIATTCAALAARPSFALVRYSDANDPASRVVAPVTLEALRGRELFVARRPLRPPADRLYESASRGWPLPPRAAMDGLGGVWNTGVAGGAITPIRDDNTDGRNPGASGIAGIATQFTAIAYSAEPAQDDGHDADAGADVLWLADRSAPAFRAPVAVKEPTGARDALPLATPPIDWLTPHPPRARVPSAQAIRALVGEVRIGPPLLKGTGPLFGLAPLLPTRFGEGVVGERAGIVYARRTSLIAREADVYVIDEREPRFGAPGGHGSSIVRQVRTPRPGPIPPNLGDRARDRRTFVWDGEYANMCRLVRGSINVVRSDRDDQPWIISIGAETATNGVVSDIWNGRATLTFEIVRRGPVKEAVRVATTGTNIALSGLQTIDGYTTVVGDRVLVKGQTNSAQNGIYLAATGSWIRASDMDSGAKFATGFIAYMLSGTISSNKGYQLSVPSPFTLDSSSVTWTTLDDNPLPAEFVWKYLLTRKAGESTEISAAARLGVGAQTFVYRSIALVEASGWNPVEGLWRGFCRFAVDVDAEQQPAVQAALAVLPPGAPAIISLTVENDGLASLRPMPDPNQWPQPLAKDSVSSMKSVERRPAVTIDVPLAVVSRSRLALPLVPTTLVFADPAYDALATTTAFQTRRTFSPTSGGPVTIALAADREPYYPSESVGFMFDVRNEKRENGEWKPIVLSNVNFFVTLRRIPRGKPAVKLNFGDATKGSAGSIVAGQAYSFAIGALRDDKDQTVAFEWGDFLEISVAIDPATPPNPGIIDYLRATTHPPLQLHIVEKPTLAPPESLYAVLARTAASTGGYRVEVPLVAQSPRADRLDFVDLVEDLRDGLVRRRAQWLWHMARPIAELDARSATLVEVYLVKADRNGQMQLPDAMQEFVSPQTLGQWPVIRAPEARLPGALGRKSSTKVRPAQRKRTARSATRDHAIDEPS